MARRTFTALGLVAIAVPAIIFGGILYFLLIGIFVGLAAWELIKMFREAEYRPSIYLSVGGTLAILAARAFRPDLAEPVFTCLVLLAMTVHLIAYERGRDQAAFDFLVTVGCFVYLGWIGSYLIDLHSLPNGGWWVMFVLPIVWLADTGAYTFGARYGKHYMTPRLSPKKSWEGYWAGVFMGTVYGAFFAYAYSTYGPLHVSIGQGLLFGFVLSTVTTLGDLGESLFKRFGAMKDSGNFLPGHGGAFDRIDSLIWGAVIGVYWIRFFLLK
jgi:phosphatidate cytidylyltransferase